MDAPKWLFPAALAAAVAAALWWLFSPDKEGQTGAQKLRRPTDPFAALGAAACTGGLAYYGGAAAGLGAAPLCAAAGTAAAPALHAASNLAVDVIDAHGTVIKTGVHLLTSGATDTYGAAKTVAQDAYSATKTVAGDAYNVGKEAAGWATLVTPAKKIWSAIF